MVDEISNRSQPDLDLDDNDNPYGNKIKRKCTDEEMYV
jgi:hypothetical protein